jgi:hypothetical protein
MALPSYDPDPYYIYYMACLIKWENKDHHNPKRHSAAPLFELLSDNDDEVEFDELDSEDES